MTDPDLSELLQRSSHDLDPAASERILQHALHSGDRRRRIRGVAVGSSVAAAAVIAVAGVSVALPSDPPSQVDGGPATASTATDTTSPTPTSAEPTTPTEPPTYAEGSETEVPGGPVVPTDRELVPDAALRAEAERLLAEYGAVTGLDVEHTWSRPVSHVADKTKNGRAITLDLDGMSASVTIQRWDRYNAVTVTVPDMSVTEDGGVFSLEDTDLEQVVVTTGREACEVSFACTETPAGWYWADRPSQGAAMPDTYQELVVTLFTDDGWVVQVDSYNTPGEKGGPPVSADPALSRAESVALATTDAWFRAR